MIFGRFPRLVRAAGYLAFGLLVYSIAFYFVFPYARIKEMVVATAAQANLDLEIEDYGPGLGFGMSMSNIKLKTRPADGSKPTEIKIPSAFLSFALLARLSGDEAFGISAAALGGDINMDVRSSPKRAQTALAVKDVQMKSLPGVKEAINVPLAGALDASMEIVQPNLRLSEASGFLSWSCKACSVGDGKEKLKIASNPMLAEGITLPKVRLGDLVGKIAFEKGVGKLQGVRARSPDGELIVDGEVRLSDPVGYSYVDLYVQFKLSDALLKSNDKLQLMIQLADSGKRPDGFYGLRVTGPLSHPTSVMLQKTSPFTNAPARPGNLRPGAPR